MKLLIKAHMDKLADDATRLVNAAAPGALERYVEGQARRAEGEWYRHVEKQTGDSGKLRTRTYRTKAGTLRAKVGSDAKYARFLMTDTKGKRVLDATLTDPMRANVVDGISRELAKDLK